MSYKFKLFDSLTKSFVNIPQRIKKEKVVSIYSCGPTVYRDPHIGNLRTYLMADFVRRVLEFQGFTVCHVKNITDVGHMRQEMLETGGDKVILEALKKGLSPKEIAEYYTSRFMSDEELLNIKKASKFPKASEHVPEMIKIIKILIESGYAYEIEGNVYFEVSSFKKYGSLSKNITLNLEEGVRGDIDPLKRNPADFTLWKKAEEGRTLKWQSPWGEGFPGWHIECSAMSMKYLGTQIDLHTGGVDNIFPHHEAEIAQSNALVNKQVVTAWMHGQHLLCDGVKMSKSLANVFTLSDLREKGFNPLTFRYICLTTHYRKRMNFSFNTLKANEYALMKLKDIVYQLKNVTVASDVVSDEGKKFQEEFWKAILFDLKLPVGLAVLWKMLRSQLDSAEKLYLIQEFDKVLGLDLEVNDLYSLTPTIQSSQNKRDKYRTQYLFKESDVLRSKIQKIGYKVHDSMANTIIRKKTQFELSNQDYFISTSKDVPNLLEEQSTKKLTFILVVSGYLDDLQRCLLGILKYHNSNDIQVIVVDNGSNQRIKDWLAENCNSYGITLQTTAYQIGDAAAKNIGLRTALGEIVILIDTSVELKKDVYDYVRLLSEQPDIGLLGPWGLLTEDMNHFHKEINDGYADVIQSYFMAIRREMILKTGFMREIFRFYRNLDIDFSFHVKDSGYQILAMKNQNIIRHVHREWEALGVNEREALSHKNFGHFLKKWRRRIDLLTKNN